MNSSEILHRPPGFRVAPAVLIRISSVLYFFLMAGHTSAYPWASTQDPREVNLVDSMKSLDFTFAGERSSYWNLYFGWGVLVAVLLLTSALLLWFLSDLVGLAPRRIGLIAGLMSASALVGAYLSFKYFYIPPFVFFLIICLVLLTVAVQLLHRPNELSALRD